MKTSFKQLSLVSLFAACVVATACESNLFSTQGPGRKPTPTNDGRISPNEPDGSTQGGSVIVTPTPTPEPTPTQTPIEITPTPDPIKTPGTEVDLCPEGSKSFSILILDLKSGWFAGDGGDFFKNFIANKCKDNIVLDYLHVTQELVEGNVSNTKLKTLLPCAADSKNGRKTFSDRTADSKCSFGSFAQYDELWILGGSTADVVDLPTSSTLFTSIVKRGRELYNTKPTSGFFIGAGLRNTAHANAFVAGVLPELIPSKKLFANLGGDVLTLPNPKSLTTFNRQSLFPGSGLTKGTISSTAKLFEGMVKLADYEKAKGRKMETLYKGKTFRYAVDECLANPIYAPNGTPVLDVIATDHCGQPVVATGTIDQHKVVADGNIARFYLTAPGEYFHRLILNLL